MISFPLQVMLPCGTLTMHILKHLFPFTPLVVVQSTSAQYAKMYHLTENYLHFFIKIRILLKPYFLYAQLKIAWFYAIAPLILLPLLPFRV